MEELQLKKDTNYQNYSLFYFALAGVQTGDLFVFHLCSHTHPVSHGSFPL
jgi:hypothetical protein